MSPTLPEAFLLGRTSSRRSARRRALELCIRSVCARSRAAKTPPRWFCLCGSVPPIPKPIPDLIPAGAWPRLCSFVDPAVSAVFVHAPRASPDGFRRHCGARHEPGSGDFRGHLCRPPVRRARVSRFPYGRCFRGPTGAGCRLRRLPWYPTMLVSSAPPRRLARLSCAISCGSWRRTEMSRKSQIATRGEVARIVSGRRPSPVRRGAAESRRIRVRLRYSRARQACATGQ